jgi:hypothetical protein
MGALNSRRIGQTKRRQIDLRQRLPAFCAMFGNDVRVNPAAHIPAPGDSHVARFDRLREHVANIVSDLFMKGTDVAKTPHIDFQRFELDTTFVGDVINRDVREIGLPGERAMAGELRNLNVDQIVAIGVGVLEGVELCGRGKRLGAPCSGAFAEGACFWGNFLGHGREGGQSLRKTTALRVCSDSGRSEIYNQSIVLFAWSKAFAASANETIEQHKKIALHAPYVPKVSGFQIVC